jgi:hypothetical protein
MMNTDRQLKLDAKVWGPHYWFFLHTVAHHYPETPNDTIKRMHYDLIQHMPHFLPDVEIGDAFSRILDRYPVTPYLDCRESLMRWVWFVHNKMNVRLEKPEMSLWAALDQYLGRYLPQPVILSQSAGVRKKVAIAVIICILIFLIYLLT